MRTEGEVRERLEFTRVELAVIQQQYRDLTDALSVQDQDLDAIALEGICLLYTSPSPRDS